MASTPNRFLYRGCVLAPTLFSVMCSATDAFSGCDGGFQIRHRFDGKLFSISRLQAKSKVQTDVLNELLYAGGIAKNVSKERKMQEAID